MLICTMIDPSSYALVYQTSQDRVEIRKNHAASQNDQRQKSKVQRHIKGPGYQSDIVRVILPNFRTQESKLYLVSVERVNR